MLFGAQNLTLCERIFVDVKFSKTSTSSWNVVNNIVFGRRTKFGIWKSTLTSTFGRNRAKLALKSTSATKFTSDFALKNSKTVSGHAFWLFSYENPTRYFIAGHQDLFRQQDTSWDWIPWRRALSFSAYQKQKDSKRIANNWHHISMWQYLLQKNQDLLPTFSWTKDE